MTLINGMKINNDERQSNNPTKNPSINEILDKMQMNYNNINYANNYKNVETMANDENKQQSVSTSNNSNDNNFLLSLLPMILEGKNASTEVLKSQQNELMHTLIKNLNNPLLEKLIELLPKINKKKDIKKFDAENKQKTEPKIDSFVKTNDYDKNN